MCMKWNFILIIIAFLCAACSKSSDTEELPSDELCVDVLFSTSGLGDSGYNDAILYGVQQASKKYGFKLNFHQPNTVEAGWKCYQEWQNDTIDSAKRLFIFASSDYEETLRKNIPSKRKNKDIIFFESGQPIENVASFRLNMYGASYYVGKLAGRIVNSAASLMANPYDGLITESEKGFRDGFTSENENSYNVFYLSDAKNEGYNMPDSAYRVSYGMFLDYAFVWPLAGGSNSGVFRYTREYPKSVFTAGVDADMSPYSNCVICSLVKRMDLVLEDYLRSWVKGDRIPEFAVYGLDSNYIQVDIPVNYQESLSEMANGLKEDAIDKEKQYEDNW